MTTITINEILPKYISDSVLSLHDAYFQIQKYMIEKWQLLEVGIVDWFDDNIELKKSYEGAKKLDKNQFINY